MKFLDIKIKNKTFGIYALVLSILIFLVLFLSFLFLLFFGLRSNVNIFTLLPFILFAIVLLLLPIGGIYIAIRYIKGNTFRRNEKLGTLLIISGLVFFGYSLTKYLLSNLTGNYGGESQPIFAFLVCTIIVPFGLILKNPDKKG